MVMAVGVARSHRLKHDRKDTYHREGITLLHAYGRSTERIDKEMHAEQCIKEG